MAVANGPIVGSIVVWTGMTLGVAGYVLVSAVLLRAASGVLPAESVALLASGLVLLAGLLLWLGSVFLPVKLAAR